MKSSIFWVTNRYHTEVKFLMIIVAKITYRSATIDAEGNILNREFPTLINTRTREDFLKSISVRLKS